MSGVQASVVTWRNPDGLVRCLASLRAQTVAPDEVVVWDNSADGAARPVADRFGASWRTAGCNVGFGEGHRRTDADVTYRALVNDDAVLPADWVERLLQDLDEHPEAAAAYGPSTDDAGRRTTFPVLDPVRLETHLLRHDDGVGAEVTYLSGAAVVVRRRALPAGPFPRPYFAYYEDTDLSLQIAAAGRTVRYVPGSLVRHAGAASTGVDSPQRYALMRTGRRHLCDRWLVAADRRRTHARHAAGQAREACGFARTGDLRARVAARSSLASAGALLHRATPEPGAGRSVPSGTEGWSFTYRRGEASGPPVTGWVVVHDGPRPDVPPAALRAWLRRPAGGDAFVAGADWVLAWGSSLAGPGTAGSAAELRAALLRAGRPEVRS